METVTAGWTGKGYTFKDNAGDHLVMFAKAVAVVWYVFFLTLLTRK